MVSSCYRPGLHGVYRSKTAIAIGTVETALVTVPGTHGESGEDFAAERASTRMAFASPKASQVSMM